VFTTRRKSWKRNSKRLAEIVIADAGPLIAFAHLELLSLLPEILGRIIVPDKVLQECLHIPTRQGAVSIKPAVDMSVLIKARQRGRISEVVPLLEQLRAKGYHLSSGLISRILQYTGEA